MWAATNPARVTSNGTDKTLDVAFDAEYQYFGEGHDVTVLSTFIHENDDWNASHPLGFTDRSSTVLNAFNLTGTYLYDKTYGVDLGIFDINGRPDNRSTRTAEPARRTALGRSSSSSICPSIRTVDRDSGRTVTLSSRRSM